MIKKVIEYPDMDGNYVSEIAYFNLSKRELRNMVRNGDYDRLQDLSDKLTKINNDTPTMEVYNLIVDLLELICKNAYGRRVQDDDHVRFIKDDTYSEYFIKSEAYDAFIESMTETPNSLVEFIENLFPKDIRDEIEATATNIVKTDPDNETVKRYMEAKAAMEARGLNVPGTQAIDNAEDTPSI